MKALKITMITTAFFLVSILNVSALTIDFDSLDAGTHVDIIDGVDFSSNVVDLGLELAVVTGFDTTSPYNYLGVIDPLTGDSDIFLPGDEIYLNFPEAITLLSVSFVSASWVDPDIFWISTDVGDAGNAADEDTVLDDGGVVYTIVFESATPFSNATLWSDSWVANFHIDDITIVPLPGSALLMMLGLLGISIRSRYQG